MHFNNITPLSASSDIQEKYYNRNVRFTRAVDELKIIENQVRETIRNRATGMETQSHHPRVVLKRLTPSQIDDALQGDFTHWGIDNDGERTKKKTNKKTQKERKKKTMKEPVVKKYNLRKR